jgi:hypothetical protein
MSILNANLALKLIPNFDDRTDGLLKFIEMCDTVGMTASLIDNTMLLSIIYSKLEGRAFEFSREATYTDWPSLKRALQKKFSQTKSVAQLQQELSQLKQIGTAEEYRHSLLKVLKNLRQCSIPAVQQSEYAISSLLTLHT